MTLLKQSIAVTLSHPIFGVGPGCFQAFNEDNERRAGRRTYWLVAHNTYTQISSETGLVGLVLFLLTLGSGFRMMRNVRRARVSNPSPAWKEIVLLAWYFRLSLLGVCLCCVFLSYPYKGAIQMSLGLVAAMEQIARREAARLETADTRNPLLVTPA